MIRFTEDLHVRREEDRNQYVSVPNFISSKKWPNFIIEHSTNQLVQILRRGREIRYTKNSIFLVQPQYSYVGTRF